MLTLPSKKSLKTVLYIVASMFCVWQSLSAMVVPHPMYKNPPEIRQSKASEQFGPRAASKNRPIPQHILALRVQFSDVGFISTPAYPDMLVHDKAYFERWMLHLNDFYAAASHGSYVFDYTVPETVFTMPNTMAYYGADTSTMSDAKVPDMLQALIQMADPQIDFSMYDAIIVFHAGAGQESDIDGRKPGQIWSTFISRSDFQEAFDPDNDNYPGIATNDGTFIKEIVLIPEHEFQDYFPGENDDNASAYLFSIYGVLCHQFGHQIGLPTLFDNNSSNGRSQGIGNWGLMGTGVWNSNGYIPAQLSAWSRYYLGWENAIEITNDMTDLPVDYFLDGNPLAKRLYKIPISDTEYFLIENRQQNPDNSYETVYDSVDSLLSVTRPSFTFQLLGPEEQDYYPHPNEHIPAFNIMENRYKGCEWDFSLPGLGGPLPPGYSSLIDGSGMLIWHIDENVINANFDPGFVRNRVNGDATHKGVDVEEADGIQHLDTAVFDYFKYGSPFDTYRQGNNDYLGHGTIAIPNDQTSDPNDFILVSHLPTAASYYGGVPLEIKDISASGLQMTFSVSFGWKLDTNYTGVNTLDACSIDYDGDGEKEIFYPMPDGNLFLWKNEELATGFPIDLPGKIVSYLWDGDAFFFAIDMSSSPNLPMLSLRKLQDGVVTTLGTMANGKKWAAPIMCHGDSLILAINAELNGVFTGWGINITGKTTMSNPYASWGSTTDSLVANLAFYKQKIYAVSKSLANGSYLLSVMDAQNGSSQSYTLGIPADSIIVAISIAPILPDSEGDILIQTPYAVYLTDLAGNIRTGYPHGLPFYSNAQVTLTDIDKNGTLDYLVSGENAFTAYDYNGQSMLTSLAGFSTVDSLYICSGVLAQDLDNDGKIEYLGSFSRNRLAVFEDNLRLKNGFPVSFSARSRHLPFIHQASDTIVYVWTPTDNGKIFRTKISSSALDNIDYEWFTKYANLKRTSSRENAPAQNQYETQELFVSKQTYIFPNPLRSIYEQKLTFQIMTSRDAKVEVSVFDIAGNLLYRKKVSCLAYLKNRELIDFPVDHLSSGVYIAVLKSGSHIKRIKFAVEK